MGAGSIEAFEGVAPLRIWRKELATDSGGPGRFRGGLGQDVEIELATDQPGTPVVARRTASSTPPLGVRSAAWPARPSRVAWNGREDGFPLKSRSSPIAGRDGLHVRYTPAAAASATPRRRDRDAVRARPGRTG